MKLIIRDYLLSLKEKDELDTILCDLCFQMGYTLSSIPKTGNRQYGVDISASNASEVLLFVVKQGNISRATWDNNQNSVRQSLNDIKDSYFHCNLKLNEDTKTIKIIVATNGYMEEAVKPSWKGYTSNDTYFDGIKIKYDFWDIEKITNLIFKYLFNEKLFDKETQSNMRKALYYVDEGDYRNSYFENVIDAFSQKMVLENSDSKKEKLARSAFLASQMVAYYAHQAGRNKLAIAATEYFIIRYWYCMKREAFGKPKLIEKIPSFLKQYEKWNDIYYETVKPFCYKKDGFFAFHPAENTVLIYEVLEHLIAYAYYLSFKFDSREKFVDIVNSIKGIIINNASFYYTPYDCHIRVVGMLYRLLDRAGCFEELKALMYNHCACLVQWFRLCKSYPSPEDDFEDVVRMRNAMYDGEYLTSVFWGEMLRWIVLYDQEALYNDLDAFLNQDLKEVTKCTWLLKADEEDALYESWAMYKAGDGTSFDASKYKKLAKDIRLVEKQYKKEKFSFDEYCFEGLEFIIAKYFGNLIRVKRENAG